MTSRDGRLVEIYVVKAEYDGSARTGRDWLAED